MRSMIRYIVLLSSIPLAHSAQVEVFGHVGSMCHSEDEGCGINRGRSYGAVCPCRSSARG